MNNKIAMFKGLATIGLSITLVACGGGDGDGGLFGNGGSDRDDLLTWNQGVFLDKAVYQDFCAAPRSGADPFNDDRPYPDKQGTTADENFFLRSWTNELYLWYDEVEDRDPNLFTTPEYFDLLKTEETTPSGSAKDNFHFTQDTFDYLNSTVSGVTFGYGLRLYVGSAAPPREFRVADVVPDSPAAAAGIERGMLITAIDGADMINGGDIATLNAGLAPSQSGEAHVFSMQAFGESTSTDFSLTSASITAVPVKDVGIVSTESGDVGYIHFNSHIRPSESDLFDAFETLAAQGVSDLVLDLRYNGGGLLAIAGQVGYMIAGINATQDKTFYSLTFNGKHPDRDPVTGAVLSPMPFFDVSLGFVEEDLPANVSLPTLNLSRVFILATDGTCSASESIINGLNGIGVEVVLIGSTTCGKPYGFYPRDNCGTTYFSIQFTGVNDQAFGEYPDGFSPENEPGAVGISVPGCFVADDFSTGLGDPEEALFAAALQYRESEICPTISGAEKIAQQKQQAKLLSDQALTLPEQPGLNNAILIHK